MKNFLLLLLLVASTVWGGLPSNITGPKQISGLIGWYDFSGTACSGNVITNSKFSTLADCSGNGNNMTHTTASSCAGCPVVHTNSQNGMSTGTFVHGTAVNVAATFASNITDSTVVIVFYPTAQTANDCLMASQSGAAGAMAPEISNAGPYQLCTYVNNHNEQANTGQGSVQNNFWNISSYRFNSSTPLGTWTMRTIPVGLDVAVGTSSQSGQTYPNTNAITIGNTGTNVLSGEVAEVLIYNNDIGAGAWTAISQYEATKWAITQPTSANPASGTKIAWWDYSGVSSTVTVSAGKVTTVTDASGYANTLSQSTSGFRPAQNLAAQNGLNTATFGTSIADAKYMTSVNLPFTDLVSYTFFEVIKMNVEAGTDQIGGSYSARAACHGFETGSNATHNQLETFWDHIGAFSRTGAGTFGTAVWHIISYVYQGSVNGSAANGQWYIDNVAQGSATTQKYGFIAGGEPIIVGSDVAGVNACQCEKGEIEYYIGALGTTPATAEYNRLKTKWGL